VPTVADRVAQTVVRMYLEPEVEPLFHPDSYGYRPGRSALDAVGMCRQRCWKFDWVIDLDLKAFFDSIDHALLLKAVSKHTNLPWVLLYVKRWLEAPPQRKDGTIVPRDRGTPQRSAISPLLANLFLHYAFDNWLAKHLYAGGVPVGVVGGLDRQAGGSGGGGDQLDHGTKAGQGPAPPVHGDEAEHAMLDVALRSRGISKSTAPSSVRTRLGVVPLREFPDPRPAGSPRS
jgi:hypothetical protein